MTQSGDVWKSETLVRTFLEGIRGAIPLAREQIDVMLRLVEARGAPVGSFADLGCGDGVLSLALLERYPEAAATLVDFSEPMIDAARVRLAEHASRCQLVTADLADSAWRRAIGERGPFDVVVSGYAIHHLTDDRKHELYGEIFGLLQPGGMFLDIEHVKSATPWLETVADDLIVDSLYAHHSSLGSGKTRDEVAEEFVHRPDKAANILALVEDQCSWLRDIGFQDVDCYFKILELAVFGGRRPRR
jgi:ubiquinone/menaquinone biosynthesis C-methylase UbiE